MSQICQLVKNILETGYLTLEDEQKLRILLQGTKYGVSELNAFTNLQYAVIQGQVRQQSREQLDMVFSEIKL
ncbi:conserved hypothetical protein [Planktothrix sp. PCC 11201]|uniref:hypothetical protein n=1 Tax=Planktothrix sp. PCC 11201 TaxID=1729650 RepID=UPI0009148641|nr:hypothetical protein [Planktothrix sp. PCC 11201]SKB11656.1 conserved hypothetical protein [Planktothrix sp. PCC 11201]